jgi:hypothetical protein
MIKKVEIVILVAAFILTSLKRKKIKFNTEDHLQKNPTKVLNYMQISKTDIFYLIY